MKLLLVEDDPLLRQSLAASLREENYAVDMAADGMEGLQKAQDSAYDAIVLDVMLPYLDGWQVLARLRPICPSPILMLTARDALPDRVKGLDHGADDYLTKPFDLEELLARLRALIRRSVGLTHPVIELGTLQLNTTAQTLTDPEGKAIPLTAREYALLEYLALHRGSVVSRTTLYEHLFDEDESTLSNLLDVHVSNLRKKLGSDLIATRRGLGYSIS
jgi:two-component system OmpR family response regulator